MKKGIAILLAAAVLLVSGCQREDTKAQKNMTETLEHLFETASEDEYAALAEPVSASGNEQAEEEMPEWMHERFASCVSDTGYEDLWSDGLLMIPVYAYEAGETLEVTDLNFQKKQRRYEFSGNVGIRKEEKTRTVKISGTIQTDGEGKVSGVQLSDAASLLEKIGEGRPES